MNFLRLIRHLSFSLSALAASTALFAIALAAFLVFGTPRRQVVAVFSSSQDRQEEHALEQFLVAHGAVSCAPMVEAAVRTETYIARARATAATSCEADGSGPQTIVALHFANKVDLAAWELDNNDYVRGNAEIGTCSESRGSTPWASSNGVLAGLLYCEPSGSVAGIAWSDQAQLDGFYASSGRDGMTALLAWWAEEIKGSPATLSPGTHTIKSLFAKAIRGGLAHCGTLQSPLADAAIDCGRIVPAAAPTGYADDLKIFHFPNARTLNAFYDNYQAAYRAPATYAGIYCDKGSLVSATYYSESRLAGRIFCYPDNDKQFLLWTIDSANIAALVERDDENEGALYRVWTILPG